MADVIVGRFALIDLIAKGGSGAVWRAWDQKTEEVCAAKVLRQRDSADLMRFVREKGVSFDHPHLLTPYGWGAEDEHVVIAMPLVSGGTLESIVRKRGKLSEPATVVILDQLLDGLAHVHAAGWIHRDVKPANIMFEPRGRSRPVSRLADFGIAVHESDVRFTHVGMVNGTPGYMAPELFSMAEPAPSHDVYAAGVVALVALNGPIKLHDGAFRPDELTQYLRGVSPKLGAVIRRMLAAQPDQRYQDANAVRRDLPKVPPGLPLTHADGAPLDLVDTLPPLPENAPGARRPERPAPRPSGPSMEAIRSGRVEQGFSASSASPQTGPRWTPGTPGGPQGPGGPGYGPSRGQQGPGPSGAMNRPGPQGALGHSGSGAPPRPGTPTGARSGPTDPRTSTTSLTGLTGLTGANLARNRGALIAIGVGVAAAVVLGAIVAVILLVMFPTGQNNARGEEAYGVVQAGQSCGEDDLGIIGVTEEGEYLSCRLSEDGPAFG